MTVPIAALLGFAVWTLLLLVATVGVYRWSLVFAGRATVREWRGDRPEGAEWYLRALRAHCNCAENLPVFASIVFASAWTSTSGAVLDLLAMTVIAARICQSVTHIAFVQTEGIAIMRFSFFLAQVISMLTMAGVVVAKSSWNAAIL